MRKDERIETVGGATAIGCVGSEQWAQFSADSRCGVMCRVRSRSSPFRSHSAFHAMSLSSSGVALHASFTDLRTLSSHKKGCFADRIGSIDPSKRASNLPLATLDRHTVNALNDARNQFILAQWTQA